MKQSTGNNDSDAYVSSSAAQGAAIVLANSGVLWSFRASRRMTSGSKAIKIALIVAATSLLSPPVYSQGFGKKGGRSGAAEQHPKIDEKAYKAALDRIPTPKKGYDPWGQLRPSEPAKTPTKSN
jgi:hypothetical protein